MQSGNLVDVDGYSRVPCVTGFTRTGHSVNRCLDVSTLRWCKLLRLHPRPPHSAAHTYVPICGLTCMPQSVGLGSGWPAHLGQVLVKWLAGSRTGVEKRSTNPHRGTLASLAGSDNDKFDSRLGGGMSICRPWRHERGDRSRKGEASPLCHCSPAGGQELRSSLHTRVGFSNTRCHDRCPGIWQSTHVQC